MSMPTPSSIKAFIVSLGNTLTASGQHTDYQVRGESAQQSKKQDSVSGPNMRSRETQGGDNSENTRLLPKNPGEDSGKKLTAPTWPVILGSEVTASTAEPLKRPTEALFLSLLEMGKADFFGTDSKKIAQALQGFDINMPVKDNLTLLDAALFANADGSDSITVVQTLIKMGARFDLVDPARPEVLKGAIKSNNIDLLKSLISRSKGKNSKEMHQVLNYAISRCEPELALATLRSMGKINPSLIDVDHLFSRAVALNSLDLVQLIYFIANPDINKLGSDGSTALAYAATYTAPPSIVEFLLSNGAQVNGTDKDLRSNAVAAALVGVSERTLANLNDKEISLVRQKKLQTLQTILAAKNVSIDFGMNIPEGPSTTSTLFGLAAKAGPEFVACLKDAQRRQESRGTGIPSSAENFKH